MFQHIVLLVLVAYPVLCLIPFNLIRFRWGFMNGSAPMPREIEVKAEVADRTALFVIHSTLFVLVAASIRGSSISLEDVGLSLANWKWALGMGLMFSLFIVGLGELFLSRVPLEDKRKKPSLVGLWLFGVESFCPVRSLLKSGVRSALWRSCVLVFLHGLPLY